jgi:tetratricopeptide (TPR) repeat protein
MTEDDGPLAENARATLAALRATRGQTEAARALAERAASESDLSHHAAYGLGAAYAQLGEPSTALRWLSRASATGFPCYPWYERDPLLDPLRADPRFGAFLSELRRSWENARNKYGTALRESGPARLASRDASGERGPTLGSTSP